ncbi:MAG: thiamine kinase [Halieaceae bacterium]
MAIDLSASQRGLIAELRADFHTWAPGEASAPVVKAALTGGQSNTVLLMEGATGRWALRIAGTARDGVCRHRECRLMQLASLAGLAPQVSHCDPERGVLITRYIAGGTDQREGPRELAALLRRIHALPCAGEPVYPQRSLPGYLSALATGHPLEELLRVHRGQLQAAQALLQGPGQPPVICHNDLLRANRLREGTQMKAIDWEYAAPNDPFFDLAVCASEETGDPHYARSLLAAYLERPAQPAEQTRLAAWSIIYGTLETCWYQRYAADPAMASTARERLGQLLNNGLDHVR